jgi:hypothetical protein
VQRNVDRTPNGSSETPASDAVVHLVVWNYALSVQAERVTSAQEGAFGRKTREIDLRFFVVALRGLLRSAELIMHGAETRAKDEIDDAIKRFHDAVPGSKDLRDRLEHFDEYERGTGRQQRRAQISEPSVTFFSGQPGHHSISVEIPGLPTASIEMETARDAGNELMTAVASAVDGQAGRSV